MKDLPVPEIKSGGSINQEEREAIISEWKRYASILSEKWKFDPELFNDLEILVKDDFGAMVLDEGIVLSDPDQYRSGMKEIFNGANEVNIREMVDDEYPVPFHELAEETGQWIGRNYPNGWEKGGNLIDEFIDETYGMLALREIHPEFFKVYSRRIEENLELISKINSEELTDQLMDDEAEVEIEYQYLDNFTRLDEIPEPYPEMVKTLENEHGYSFTELDREELEEIRKSKLKNEASEWEGYVGACRIVEPEGGEFDIDDPENFINMSYEDRERAVEYAFGEIMDNVRAVYGIPNPL